MADAPRWPTRPVCARSKPRPLGSLSPRGFAVAMTRGEQATSAVRDAGPRRARSVFGFPTHRETRHLALVGRLAPSKRHALAYATPRAVLTIQPALADRRTLRPNSIRLARSSWYTGKLSPQRGFFRVFDTSRRYEWHAPRAHDVHWLRLDRIYLGCGPRACQQRSRREEVGRDAAVRPDAQASTAVRRSRLVRRKQLAVGRRRCGSKDGRNVGAAGDAALWRTPRP